MSAKCWKFGDDVSTDEIISTQYMVLSEPEKLGEHAFESARPDFSKLAADGDFIVAGRNFGYGSSREHAVMALKGAGIRAVIAKSFARIFFRNSINLGLIPIVSAEASDRIGSADEIAVDLDASVIRNKTKNEEYLFAPFPSFIREYFENGGLINTLNKHR